MTKADKKARSAGNPGPFGHCHRYKLCHAFTKGKCACPDFEHADPEDPSGSKMVYHILPHCKQLIVNRDTCWKSDCTFGHDHVRVRRQLHWSYIEERDHNHNIVQQKKKVANTHNPNHSDAPPAKTRGFEISQAEPSANQVPVAPKRGRKEEFGVARKGWNVRPENE
ncbi:hypothetical protein BU16DRAFT_527215 [Lophium mytilinum]|uniref:Uncharacterized protein n=1 Tax=Lophium mytilinum TaxID=390894 RepID=A0A6A6QTB8_9PEZI|nr:hypothetical protein BU16DRAFT_527215 [Lophium mytilinum]